MQHEFAISTFCYTLFFQGGRNKYSRQVLQTILHTTDTDSEIPAVEEVYTVGGKNRYSRQAHSLDAKQEAISVEFSSGSSILSDSSESLFDL
jgi:hypothetical protein